MVAKYKLQLQALTAPMVKENKGTISLPGKVESTSFRMQWIHVNKTLENAL